MMSPNIFDWIKSEENNFETEKVRLGDNWEWNFRDHVQMIFHLKNGVFYTGENTFLRAFKNVMEPILDLAHWLEDIEVKDVTFFIENKDGKALSFLVKKYHDDVYVKEHDLDKLFDSISESDIDYGGVLVQKGVKMPEVIPLNSIAFCDQTDILGSPIAFKHYFSPSKLKKMKKFGWGDPKNGATISIDELCTLASFEKDAVGTTVEKTNSVPGKTIEVYIVRGDMPDHYLLDNDDMEYYCKQTQIVAYYVDKNNKRQGVTLYRKEDEEDNMFFFTSKEVFNRALGRGYGEILLHPQVWTNFATIHKMNLIEAASKVPLQTDDPNFATRNKVQDMENLEITVTEEGKRILPIQTASPANIQVLQSSINEWFEHAQLGGAAFDPVLGKEQSSGTTFRGQERTVAQGRGSHDRNRGKRAKFIEELYRKLIIPDIKKEIVKGKKFLATLTSEELKWVSEQIAIVRSNNKIKELILEGKNVTKEQQDMLMQVYREAQMKAGNKQLVEILGDELKDIEIKMGINIAGKQKDLAMLSDKLLSVFQFIFSNPAGFMQAMQIPALQGAFENILEFSGLSIGDFSSLVEKIEQPVTSPIGVTEPQQIAQSPMTMSSANNEE